MEPKQPNKCGMSYRMDLFSSKTVMELEVGALLRTVMAPRLKPTSPHGAQRTVHTHPRRPDLVSHISCLPSTKALVDQSYGPEHHRTGHRPLL